MSHVSKRKLSNNVVKELEEQLLDVFVAHQGRYELSSLTSELFTRTERLMFAKRIGVLVLLDADYGTHEIAEILNMSPSTVARIELAKERGRYKSVIQTIQKKKYRDSIVGTLETILTLGIEGSPTRKLNKKIRDDIEAWKAGR